MIYQISYELRNSDRDYSDFFVFLEQQLGSSAIHVLRDIWWVSNPIQQDINDLTNTIRNSGLLDPNDLFFVVIISSHAINGWMPEQTWKWYNEHKDE